MEHEDDEILKIKLRGKNPDLWKSLRHKFLTQLESILETVINFENSGTVRDELKNVSSELLKFTKEKLRRPGFENQKVLAEIDDLYSSSQHKLAQARMVNAQAKEVELKNKLLELKMSLAIVHASLIGESDEESLVFIKRIEMVKLLLSEISPTQGNNLY